MKTIFKIVVGIIVAFVLLAVGVVALLGGAANEVAKEIDKDHAADAEHAMSPEEYKQVKTGVRYREFIAEYGKPIPDQTQEITVQGSKNVTVYYNVEGGDLLDTYQFSFTDGTLESKARW